jgi:hypothetical protein
MVVTIGLVNVASVMGAVALARRRGGQILMVATAIAIAVMCHSLGTERLHDIWNPYVALMPLLLLIFLCWSIACGEHRLLPLAVLIASFVAQAQVAFAFPAAGLVIVALAGALVSCRHSRGNRLPLRRSLAAAFLIAVVFWSAPLYDQAIHRPGNFAAIVQAGTAKHSRLGAATGWRAVVRTVGIPPWWLRDPPAPLQRLSDVSTVSTFQTLTAAAVVGALLATGIAGVRRRRVDITAAAAIALVLLAAIAIVAATTPTRSELRATITWTLWWSSPVGMWIYLSLGWAAASLARQGRRPAALHRSAARLKAARPLAPAIAAIAALIAAATYTIATQQPDELRPLYDPARTIAKRVTASLPAGGSVGVGGSPSFLADDFQAALIYALRRDGWNVATGEFLAIGLVSPYRGRPPYDHSVGVHDGEPAPPAERVIARVLVAPTRAKPRIVAVGVSGRSVR